MIPQVATFVMAVDRERLTDIDREMASAHVKGDHVATAYKMTNTKSR